jgi:hypothetical protein
VTQKSYVGVTSGSGSPDDLMLIRWKKHCYAASSGSSLLFSNAIRAYGKEQFEHKVLEVCSSPKESSKREIFWIEKLQTFGSGYNMTPGGELRTGEHNPRSKLSKDDVIFIKERWNIEQPNGNTVGEFYKKTANQFGVTPGAICRLIKGLTWSHTGPTLTNVISLRGTNKLTGKKISELWSDPCKRELWSSSRRGSKNGRSVLTDADVHVLRKEFQLKESWKFGEKSKFYRKYADIFNVTPNAICGIVLRKSWM